jgi:sugar phosphate isomerase/epimerase
MAPGLRFAICNEIFGESPMDQVCADVAAAGFEGFEIAPFTLGTDPAALDANQRRGIGETVRRHGLEFVGLHWLLTAPSGLHATTRDEIVRRRTWNYVHHFVDLCADLAARGREGNGVLVFGSPKQRVTRDGLSPKEATDIFVHELAHVAPHAESRGVNILVEALPLNQCDVITSLGEAVSIIKQIGSPAIQTMFDVHNAVDEAEPHAELLRRYAAYIRHVHVNEIDGREPGMGDYDFGPILQTLVDLDYQGWVSVEAFDFSRSPIEIARRSINRLREYAGVAVASEQKI